MKMNTTFLKYIAILVLIIFLSALGVRIFTGGESLADYAEKNPEIAFMEPIPEEEGSPQTSSSDGGAASGAPSMEETGKLPGPSTDDPKDTASSDFPNEQIDHSKGDNISLKEENKTDTPKSEPGDTPLENSSRIVYRESFYYEAIPDDIADRITGISYKENPNITLDDLRYVKVLYHDFSSETQVGELICNQAIAQDLTEIFYELYQNDYQIERIALVDEYDGDDTLSMEANNTSCFNYRVVDGTTRLSKHALGLAIDINPFYNPYIVYNKNGTGETYISPKGSEIYADRSQDFPYKIGPDDLCYRLFKERGFTWGGDWNSTKDYQHFQKAID